MSWVRESRDVNNSLLLRLTSSNNSKDSDE